MPRDRETSPKKTQRKTTPNKKGEEAFSNGANKKQVILKQKTINLPEDVLITLEDMARDNKRSGAELNTASAIMRYALDEFFKAHLDS